MSEDTAPANLFPAQAADPTPPPPVEAPKEKKPRAPAAVLTVSVDGGEPLKALKYPMPLKAPRYDIIVNGEVCSAAQTTFGSIRYTYFEFNGASFYIPGHHNQDSTYEFSYPENYAFQPLKLDRAAQSAKAAAAKAAKPKPEPAAASQEPDAAPVQAAAASEDSGTTSESPQNPEALHEAPSDSAKVSRRARR